MSSDIRQNPNESINQTSKHENTEISPSNNHDHDINNQDNVNSEIYTDVSTNQLKESRDGVKFNLEPTIPSSTAADSDYVFIKPDEGTPAAEALAGKSL